MRGMGVMLSFIVPSIASESAHVVSLNLCASFNFLASYYVLEPGYVLNYGRYS